MAHSLRQPIHQRLQTSATPRAQTLRGQRHVPNLSSDHVESIQLISYFSIGRVIDVSEPIGFIGTFSALSDIDHDERLQGPLAPD